MRIKAKIEISNRSLAVHNISGRKGKDLQASLAIGRKPKHLIQSSLKESNHQNDRAILDPSIFLMVSTTENKSGNKYAITFQKTENSSESSSSNVEKIFDRFIAEGKATVRFCEPPHDLCIKKADPIQLKAFTSLIRKIVELSSSKGNENDLENLLAKSNSLLSALNPASKNQVKKEKTRLIIVNKKDYPITTSFPSTLEVLRATGINLKRIDSRIFKLQSLGILDLSNNAINTIPPEITRLSSLKELNLCQNNIETIPSNFCDSAPFCMSLRLLDLGENKITFINPHLAKFRSLVTLKLNDNLFSRLPPNIFGTSLRSFNINGCTELKCLPGTALNIKLNNFYASRLPLLFMEDSNHSSKLVLDTTSRIPSLLDITSRKILSSPTILNKMQTEEDSVPQTLALKVESMVKCFCGLPCARSSYAVALSRYSLKPVASNLECEYLVGGAIANFESVFCSKDCLKRYGRNRFAI